MTQTDESQILLQALNQRISLIDPTHRSAIRVFNGFYEGLELVADLYGATLLLTAYGEKGQSIPSGVRELYLRELPWIKCVFEKNRYSNDPLLRNGRVTFGNEPDKFIVEHGIRYALELDINQDNSFYIDTRNLRKWLVGHSAGLEVLNTFAYTGSLGIAALAGGASQVTQIDRNRRFLDLASRSAGLNRFDLGKMKLIALDFFVGVGQFKKAGRDFDLVVLDPPFFSITEKGLVDQARESHRLINKVRPLVKDGGHIVAINNSLFLPGSDYLRSLEALGSDGFLEIEELIPVPEDVTGFPETIQRKPPVDPAPFNHPTKIAILKVKRKNH